MYRNAGVEETPLCVDNREDHTDIFQVDAVSHSSPQISCARVIVFIRAVRYWHGQCDSLSPCAGSWKLTPTPLKRKLFLRQRVNMKVALCITCLHVVAVVSMASGRHQPLQHHRPEPLQDHRSNSKGNIEALLIPGSRYPPPRHPGVRGYDFLRMRGGSRDAGKGLVHVCDICPASEAIAPCMVSLYPYTRLICHTGTFSQFIVSACVSNNILWRFTFTGIYKVLQKYTSLHHLKHICKSATYFIRFTVVSPWKAFPLSVFFNTSLI